MRLTRIFIWFSLFLCTQAFATSFSIAEKIYELWDYPKHECYAWSGGWFGRSYVSWGDTRNETIKAVLDYCRQNDKKPKKCKSDGCFEVRSRAWLQYHINRQISGHVRSRVLDNWDAEKYECESKTTWIGPVYYGYDDIKELAMKKSLDLCRMDYKKPKKCKPLSCTLVRSNAWIEYHSDDYDSLEGDW